MELAKDIIDKMLMKAKDNDSEVLNFKYYLQEIMNWEEYLEAKNELLAITDYRNSDQIREEFFSIKFSHFVMNFIKKYCTCENISELNEFVNNYDNGKVRVKAKENIEFFTKLKQFRARYKETYLPPTPVEPPLIMVHYLDGMANINKKQLEAYDFDEIYLLKNPPAVQAEQQRQAVKDGKK